MWKHAADMQTCYIWRDRMLVYKLYADLLKENHIIVAGQSGSGKSVVINGLIKTALEFPVKDKALILIDPKMVELIDYKRDPHTLLYADTPYKIIDAINFAVRLMEKRYKIMQRKRQKKSNLTDIYVIIDEYADLITTSKKEIETQIIRIAQLGRAANVHLIIATQRPTSEIITGTLKVNIDCRLALHTATKRDSINIIEAAGAEELPKYGYGILRNADGINTVKIPMIE